MRKRRTMNITEEAWKVIYEVSVFLSKARVRRVSLSETVSAIFNLLIRDDWFRKNRARILEEYDLMRGGKDAKDAANLPGGSPPAGPGT